MSIFAGIPLETLAEALSLAQAALPPLLRGEAVGAIATGDKRITFVPTTPAALAQHIRDLQAAIAALSNSGLPRKGFYLFGGKGL
jgi:hypothetical protein